MQLYKAQMPGQKGATKRGGYILTIAYLFRFVIPADIALILLG